MKVIAGNLWLCVDCTMVAVNDDDSGIDSPRRAREVRAAVIEMGPHLVPNSAAEDDPDDYSEQEFSWSPCDCCGSNLGGHRERFALLAPE